MAVGGFGRRENGTADSMAWFRGRLYVGVTSHKVLKPGQKKAGQTGGDVSRRASVPGPAERAQIWRYDVGADRWELAFQSPMLRLRDGRLMPRDIGYRGMVVFQGSSDPEAALYVTTISVLGSLVLRSTDGRSFSPVSTPGLGNPGRRSLRTLVPFQGRLYTSPTGRTGAELLEWNLAETPVVLESEDPAGGVWRTVSEVGFGDPGNSCVVEMAAYNGFLYAGTFNPRMGFQVWKTDAHGWPYRWTRVLTAGASRGKSNQSVASMMEFQGALYVGGGIQGLGYLKAAGNGPAAAELIRIHRDDRWDLVVGEARSTFDGPKRPLSGQGPGFENNYNSVLWRMVEHEGWLYVGSNDWSGFLAHLMRHAARSIRARSWGEEIEHLVTREGGFDLFRSRDGERWDVVTTTGFGSPYNYGARTLCAAPPGLFVGTVTMRMDIPALAGAFPDHAGGCEVWLSGRSPMTCTSASTQHDEEAACKHDVSRG